MLDNGLKPLARELIDDAIFYLGGKAKTSVSPYYGTTEEVYAWERGKEVYNNTRPTSWEGKVALMYPSDMYMTYANNSDYNCYNDPTECSVSQTTTGTPTASWLYNTNILEGGAETPTGFLSPCVDNSKCIFFAYSSGDLNYADGNASFGVRPTLYLSSNVQIFDGDGSEQNPYKLKK